MGNDIDALSALLTAQEAHLRALNALLEEERAGLPSLSATPLERLERLREAKLHQLALLERDEQARRELLRSLGYPHGDRTDTDACVALFGLEPQWRRLLAELERARRLTAQLAGLLEELSDFNAHRLAWAQRQQGASLYDARGRRSTMPQPNGGQPSK
ncbi:flagellar export chaperone FlgN [Halotalea alkalilenta]|uniref:flagellar export chaperone FlgN n=1 Tax=Halotalea alkalilenta TaxID=376489 RepID=UPI000485620F|nr:flagellar export chaperone FlgN [Halotalea alkalilenta]